MPQGSQGPERFARRAFWDGGAQVFIHKGQNGRWIDKLTPEDVRRYEETSLAELGPECTRWLTSGELP